MFVHKCVYTLDASTVNEVFLYKMFDVVIIALELHLFIGAATPEFLLGGNSGRS